MINALKVNRLCLLNQQNEVKMFFRIKKIKGKEYAYVVENRWKPTAKSVELNASSRSREHRTLRGMKPRGSRQKVRGYLGRIYRFNLKNDINLLQFVKAENLQGYLDENDANKIITDLIEWEFFKFGISNEGFFADLAEKKIQKNNKNVVILINDGFLCNLTLKNLLEFKPENEENDGYRLARAFVEAGIKVPQEIFIGLFGKLYKTKE